MTASVRLIDVGHCFQSQPLLFQGLNTTFSSGESWALVGPSGAGKSTLLGLIAGWEEPRFGSISRVDIAATTWVFQNPHGQPFRTAVDHVAFPIAVRGATRRDATNSALSILEIFNLADLAERPFASLSGGEAQRLMLARAVAGKADLLLVDEPTAQLDRASAQTVNDVLQKLASAGAIVLIATHDEQTMLACDHRLSLDRPEDRNEADLHDVGERLG